MSNEKTETVSMRRSGPRLGGFALLISLVVGSVLLVSCAPRSDDQGAQFDPVVEDGGDPVRVGSTWEDSALVGYAADDDDGAVSSRSLPLEHGDEEPCVGSVPAAEVVRTYDTFPWDSGSGAEILWPGGDVDLLCGTADTSGFTHIKDRYRVASADVANSWEMLSDSLNAVLDEKYRQSWDKHMLDAIQNVLDWGDFPMPNADKRETCFAQSYSIFDGHKVVDSYYVNVVVSTSESSVPTVRTAFLSDDSNTSTCAEGW